MLEYISNFFSFLRRRKLSMIMTTNAKKKQYKNKYEMIDYYVENDPTLYSTIRFISLAIGSSFSEFRHKHKNISKEAQALAFNLMKYGDVVISKQSNKMIPMYSLTILESKDDIGKYSDKVISDAELYVINEDDPFRRKIYKKSDVLHLSLNNMGTLTKDIKNRYCYNIYSISPIIPLTKILEWKEFLIDSDIMWRDKLVPREHHKLDLDISYQMLPGKTFEEKMQKAKAMIEKEMADYIASISDMESGENYVTSKDVEIDVIETKTDYRSPNELIEQLDNKIITTFNVPLSAIKGKSSGSYASELAVTSYFMLSANAIIDIINEYMNYKYPATDFSNVKVTLEVWKTEIYKRAILASKSGALTADEVRQMLGFNPIGLKNIQNDIDGRTLDGITRATEPNTNTPHRDNSRNKLLEDRSIE